MFEKQYLKKKNKTPIEFKIFTMNKLSKTYPMQTEKREAKY